MSRLANLLRVIGDLFARSGLKAVLAKLGTSLFVVFCVVTLTFWINRAIPADPARMVAGPQARPADVAKIRAQLGLDRPLLAQYFSFLSRLVHTGPRLPAEKEGVVPVPIAGHETCSGIGHLHADLGKSYQQRRPVLAVLAKRLPYTIGLALAATFLSVSMGVAAGVLAAWRRPGFLDGFTVFLTLLGVSAPTFILGIGLQYLFAYQLQVLPLNGAGATLSAHLLHVILPALTLGLYGAASYTRITRGELIETLRADYLRTARAKGASRARAILVHGLRNAVLPIVTVIGLDLGALFGGAVITEQIFSWPGIGSLAVRSMVDRDGPVILGTVLLGALGIVLSNLVVEASYALLDPRLRKRG